nr:MFS transporter [Candidatus Pantoea persica]
MNLLQDAAASLALSALVVFIAGGVVGMLAEMFPTHVRYTGLGPGLFTL